MSKAPVTARVLVRIPSPSVSTLFSFLPHALPPLISALPHHTCPPRPASGGSPHCCLHLCPCLSFPVFLQPSSASASLHGAVRCPVAAACPSLWPRGRAMLSSLCRAGDASSWPSAPLSLGQHLAICPHAAESCGPPRTRAQCLPRRVLGEPGCPRGEVGWNWGAGRSPSSVSSSTAHGQPLLGLTLAVKKEGYPVKCREESFVGASDFREGARLSWGCWDKVRRENQIFPHIYCGTVRATGSGREARPQLFSRAPHEPRNSQWSLAASWALV